VCSALSWRAEWEADSSIRVRRDLDQPFFLLVKKISMKFIIMKAAIL
jgi:hypothetical protein